MSLAQHLDPHHVLVGCDVTSKKRLFEEIGFLFERTMNLPRTTIADSLFARERLGSTGLGCGVAIPHGRIKGLKTPQLAAVQLKEAIGFDAIDGVPVELFFILLVPENATQEHLDLLAELAQLLGHETTRLALKSASTVAMFMAAISATQSHEA